MQVIHTIKWAGRLAAVLLVSSVMANTAQAADVYLRAAETIVDLDGRPVPMWGYAEEAAFGQTLGTVQVPGPALVVAPGDTTLRIHLDNRLPEPTSIVIVGQPAALNPTWNDGTTGPRPAGNFVKRVRSFVQETPPNNATEVVYSWTNLKAGSYIYHSGTHPAVQVQMGLYGAVIKNAAAGQPYPGVTAAADITVFLSEVDPALHDAVAAGTYGTPAAMASTIDYNPAYFLINGAPYTASDPNVLPTVSAGQRVVLRFFNAGLRQRVPVLLNAYMTLVAEDGNPLPYARDQYSVFLPPLKTTDAIAVPAAGSHPLFDRALGLSNDLQQSGGMLTYLVAQ